MRGDLKIILIYMLVASIVGFVAMGVDKAKAKVGAWRIPEKTLFLIALCGGAAGVWFGMEAFRHKTKHWYFKYGVPLIFVAELVAVIYLFA